MRGKISVNVDLLVVYIISLNNHLFLGGSKITADADCSHEIKRHLLLGRKVINHLAAAAAKALQSCPTVRPHRQQPTRLLCPWDFPGKSTGVGCHCLLQNHLDNILKSRDTTLPTNVHLVKAMFFSNSHVWIWELGYKESWVLNNWCFWIVMLEKTLEEIQPVHPKGNQSWIFTGRTEAETPILWPHDVKNWFFGKDPDAGKDWRREQKGAIEDEMVGWHHQRDGHEFE